MQNLILYNYDGNIFILNVLGIRIISAEPFDNVAINGPWNIVIKYSDNYEIILPTKYRELSDAKKCIEYIYGIIPSTNLNVSGE